MPDPAPTSATPGDSTGAPTVVVTPQPTVTAGGDDNAGLLAELQAELTKGGGAAQPAAGMGAGGGGDAPEDGAAEEPGEETPDEPTDEPAEQATEGDDEEPADEPPLEEEDLEDDELAVDPDEDDPAIAAAADKDPALKARLDAVRRTEERQRARLANERQAFEGERQQFITERGAALQRLQQFDQLVARAKYDLPSVVRALGIEPADFEYHAQQLVSHSPKFANDEKYRGAAEKAMREREAADRAAANERKLAELESKLEAKEQQAAADREVDTYFARSMRKVTDATPITQQFIKNAPKAARAALMVTANELIQKHKLTAFPRIADLLAAQEAKEIRAARLRGFQPGAKTAATTAPATNGVNGPKPATGGAKPNGQTAPAKPGKKPAAAVPAATPAATTVDPKHIPTRDELLQELQSGAAN